jgi:hypothetical protein
MKVQPATAIRRLRLLRRALQTSKRLPPDVAEWIIDALTRYEQEAASGLDLDRAFDLIPEPGRENWWTAEARQRRDVLIRQLRDQCFPDLGVTEAAREIGKLGRAYQSSAGCFDRHRPDAEIADERKSILRDALLTGSPFPKTRHLLTILRNEP